MKIGDKVRFLSSIGGGKIAGFQKGNIVLVEDEDGFQIPTLASEVVVIGDGSDDYNMFKSGINSKSANNGAESPNNKSIKSKINDIPDETDIETDNDFDDPSLGDITFKAPISERKGGDRLSAYIAFVPIDASIITNTRFEVYLINDSNYYMRYLCTQTENNAATLRAEGEIEPNTKLFLEEIGRDDLNDIKHLGIQIIAYKRDKSFIVKAPLDMKLYIDGVKFYKLHTFKANKFFEQNALIYTLIENDQPVHPVSINAKELSSSMYADAKQATISNEDGLNNERIDTYVRRYEKPGQKQGNPFVSKKSNDNTIVVDLHIDALLDNTQGMSSADMLQYQLDTFHKKIDENKKKRGTKIIFIHGKGEGVLRRAIIHELTYRYKHLRYQDASFQEYGYGATQVTI